MYWRRLTRVLVRSDALRILAELKKRKQEGYVPEASFVIVYLGLGENEQAFAWLDKAYKEKSNLAAVC